MSNMESTETNKLFIGNLSRNIRRQGLKEHFGQYWEVAYASVALDRETNRSRWFWFVTFVNEADAIKAQAELNETELDGRQMYIDFARVRDDEAGDASEGGSEQQSDNNEEVNAE
jgi:RNA recognition motif-containing protein